MKDLGLGSNFDLREIKSKQITPGELDHMKELSGSYESLFSRRSRQFGVRELKGVDLSELDYRGLILEEYTFLKRPVTILDDEIYIGNSKKEVEKLRLALS